MSDPLREALEGLVDTLDEISRSAEFKSVWTLHMIHGGIYCGPTWVDALERARRALDEPRRLGEVAQEALRDLEGRMALHNRILDEEKAKADATEALSGPGEAEERGRRDDL